jgi:hypothetical protein
MAHLVGLKTSAGQAMKATAPIFSQEWRLFFLTLKFF